MNFHRLPLGFHRIQQISQKDIILNIYLHHNISFGILSIYTGDIILQIKPNFLLINQNIPFKYLLRDAYFKNILTVHPSFWSFKKKSSAFIINIFLSLRPS